MVSGLGKALMDVASPSSVCSRQTKPGAASPSALTGANPSANPAVAGWSIGWRSVATLSCARWSCTA